MQSANDKKSNEQKIESSVTRKILLVRRYYSKDMLKVVFEKWNETLQVNLPTTLTAHQHYYVFLIPNS